MWERLKSLGRDDEGPTAIEYGLIALLIAMAIVAAVTLVGQKLTTPFGNVANNLPTTG